MKNVKKLLLILLTWVFFIGSVNAITVSFLPQDVVIPTQPAFQNDPLKCHGLAFALAKEAKLGASIEVYRVSGPNNSFPDHNSGPYLIRSAKIADLKQYIQNFVASNNQFSKVEFDYIEDITKVDVRLVSSMRPLKTCIENGVYDKPSRIIKAMGIPYTTGLNNCGFDLANGTIGDSELLIYGCPHYPESETIKKFIENGGTVAHTDGVNQKKIFQLYPNMLSVKPEKTTAGQHNIWEGKTNNDFDLSVNEKKFFQPVLETMHNWKYMIGHTLLTGLSPEVTVLASGTLCGPTSESCPQAVLFEPGKGRYFYFTFHIEGASTPEDKLFMSSLYSGALSTKLNVFPRNCDDSAKPGESKQLCPHLEADNHSFIVWPALEEIENLNIKVKLDGSEIQWIKPVKNNFDLKEPEQMDFTLDVPNDFELGTYPLEIIFDGDNATPITATGILNVYDNTNQAPTANFKAIPRKGFVPLTVYFNGSDSSDPDGDLLSYNWEFSDRMETKDTQRFSLEFNSLQPVNVTLTVEDPSGLTDSITKQIFPYGDAFIEKIESENNKEGNPVDVTIKCSHDLPVTITLFKIKTADEKILVSQTEHTCNQQTRVLDKAEMSVYEIFAELKTTECKECSKTYYFNAPKQKTVLDTPEINPFLTVLIFIGVLLITGRKHNRTNTKK